MWAYVGPPETSIGLQVPADNKVKVRRGDLEIMKRE
jgi:hypothetical protein